jgi:hypothetical protein
MAIDNRSPNQLRINLDHQLLHSHNAPERRVNDWRAAIIGKTITTVRFGASEVDHRSHFSFA